MRLLTDKGGKPNKDEKPGVTVLEYSLGAALCLSLEILKAQPRKAQSKLNFWHWPCFEHGVGPDSSRGPSSLMSQMNLWLQTSFSGPEVSSSRRKETLLPNSALSRQPKSQSKESKNNKLKKKTTQNKKTPTNPFFFKVGETVELVRCSFFYDIFADFFSRKCYCFLAWLKSCFQRGEIINSHRENAFYLLLWSLCF